MTFLFFRLPLPAKMVTGWMVWTRVELAGEQELRLSIQLAKLTSVGEKKKVRWQARKNVLVA